MNTVTSSRADSTQPSLAGPSVRLKRNAKRGSCERDDVFAIIDEALLVHVAFNVAGTAMSLPTAHVRIEDRVYLHGARANRSLLALCESDRASLTFTLLDGLVLARTAFHHSMNYRCAVVFGAAREVEDLDEKRLALAALVDHITPGRMRELGEPSAAELAGTLVVCVDIEEGSAKMRSGPPIDGPGDEALDVWAGVVPLALRPEAPEPDAQLRAGISMSQAASALALSNPSDLVVQRHGEYELSSDRARVDVDYVYRFLSEDAYWSKGIREDELRAALQHSLCFGLYRGPTQLGFARVVTDRGRFAYLCDVFIDERVRGQGLGKALVEWALQHPAVRGLNRVMLGTLDAHGLYERFGFVKTSPGRFMIRVLDTAT